MFITTYSRAILNFKELISKHWSYLGRSSATSKLRKQDFMITYRKPPSLKDILVRARIAQSNTTKFPSEGKLKTWITTKPTIHSEMALAKITTSGMQLVSY